MARKKKRSSMAKRAQVVEQRATGAIGAVRARVATSVRDYVKAVESLLDWLEHEVDRATAVAREQLDRLLKEASRQIEALESSGKKARRRLTEPYRRQAAKLLSRLEDGISEVAPNLVPRNRATPAPKRRRKKKRSTKKRA
jgi:hypothetical protein